MRFLFGIYGVSKDGDPLREKKAIDWRRLVREGIIDGVVIESLKPDPARPLESTRELYEMVAKDKGRCQLFCPVSAYTFQGCGIANYAEWLGVSKEEATRKLVKADGILMECVDYRNYTPEMCEVLRQDTQAAPLDVSSDRARHVVVAQGTPETYNGHATLARTKSGKMIAVWTIGHGGPCGPAAESLDGGKTWTAPADSAPALSGHRHAGVKDSAGRWTIVFRDFEPKSPFGHNYCAWRGTYADIVARRPGEKIKLLENCSDRKADCGYGACVLMPDDTVFALTYIKYNPGPEKHSIVGLWLPK